MWKARIAASLPFTVPGAFSEFTPQCTTYCTKRSSSEAA